MAKYQVLRDCACEDRFFYGGSVMDLIDGLDVKYPKNFKLIEEIPTVTHPVATGEQYLESVTTASTPMAVEDVRVSTPFFNDATEEEEPPLYVSDKPPKPKAKKKKTGK